MAPSLLDLPPELLDMIARQCDKDENDHSQDGLLQLRLTCREVERSTRRAWRSAYFTQRTVKLELKKIATLKSVADNPEFGKAVTRLKVLCVDDAKLSMLDPINGGGVVEGFLAQCTGVMSLAFHNLSNLETILFVPDGSGWTDRIAHDADGKVIDCSATFQAVLLAIQACGLRPRMIQIMPSFETQIYTGIACCDAMLRLKDCLSSLEVLALQLLSHSKVVDREIDRTLSGRYLAGAIGSMKSLRKLALSLEQSSISARTMEAIATNMRLPCLSNLTIFTTTCYSSDLLRLLRAHCSTLKYISLINLHLSNENAQHGFRIILEEIGKRFMCECLTVSFIESRYGQAKFLGMWSNAKRRGVTAGGGNLKIGTSEKEVDLYGVESVKAGVSEMLDCLTWVHVPSDD